MDNDADIINAQINMVAKDMFEFTDKNPNWRTPDTLIISRSGCKVTKDRFIHTDNCSCDMDYMESLSD